MGQAGDLTPRRASGSGLAYMPQQRPKCPKLTSFGSFFTKIEPFLTPVFGPRSFVFIN